MSVTATLFQELPQTLADSFLLGLANDIRVKEAKPRPDLKPELRGGASSLWDYDGPEVMISGPADTGKTWAAVSKLHRELSEIPGLQAVVIRKTLNSLYPSVFQTYRKIIGPDHGLKLFGGSKPEWVDYPNGSRMYVAGLDNPEKALSTERDRIYVNQAEELDIRDWEMLSTRCNGRAGNAPYPQMIGDCNPGPPSHWILHRDRLQLFESRHEDNPTIYDAQGELLESGRRRMDTLDALTGVRYARLRLGKWVSAEGQVYEDWDRAVHMLVPFEIPTSWRRFRVIDFGYTNPFVCHWWAVDGDGRMYLYREIYYTQRLVKDHAAQIKALSEGERIEATICDHDAEDRATLEDCGIPNQGAVKEITPGIQGVQDRLRKAGDGKPRLFVLHGALVERDESLAERRLPVCTEQEWESYVWPKGVDGKAVKEIPLDLNNHGMDCVRYGARYLDDGFPPMRGAIATPKKRTEEEEEQPEMEYELMGMRGAI